MTFHIIQCFPFHINRECWLPCHVNALSPMSPSSRSIIQGVGVMSDEEGDVQEVESFINIENASQCDFC